MRICHQGLRVVGALVRLAIRWAAPGLVLVALAGYVLLLPTGWSYASTAKHRGTPETVRPAPVALVLGAGIWDGRPSPMLSDRLDLAADLYRRGKVRAVLVSGDNRIREYDEPTVMRDDLIGRGVPERRIVRDFAGLDTWDSCARAKRIFGVRRLIVVTQDFHLPRAVALCRAAGLDAAGVGAASARRYGVTALAGYLRETPGMLKAVGDIVRQPDPRLLGPAEPGVTRALDDEPVS
ncbi:hypothetical protein DPM19_18400 [Actinomadura craniellae]|uniref:DUF218 domain-containing protein n=1 Tax=Actinomadura craniellae TaxID=2231787 RepID=A0A365H5X7_9ACTN|nr:ElyC/SanA/YdcF family protein [Actinomadura craniellae]RAY13643.1 hypothetical protein DPM19_18400 [Actinomadura craniellae]